MLKVLKVLKGPFHKEPIKTICYEKALVGAVSGSPGTVELREGSLTAISPHQVLVGPAYIYTFSSSALVLGLVLDRFNRPLIMGAGEDDLTATASEDDLPATAGVVVFSLSCVLMGVSRQFWQLVVLRMGIALGEAVCRPAASSLIADRFRSDKQYKQGSFSYMS